MHNVFKGIVIGFIGLIVWVLFSVPLGIDAALGVAENPMFHTLMALGFLLMVGGPVVYIVILPIWGWWRRKRSVRTEPQTSDHAEV